MAIIRANAVFQGPSGLPEDQFINTFHFDSSGTPYEDDAPLAAAALIEFYTAITTPTAAAVDWFLSNTLLPQAEIVTYNLDDPEPRIPTSFPFTIDPEPKSTDRNYPEEVAVCLSFRGAPPITARRRGRVYIGPLSTRAAETGLTTPSRPSPSFRNVLAESAVRLLASGGTGPAWVIRSLTPTPNTVLVQGGWVDNAWDTQRRRGLDATTRTIWPNPA